jgi:hypothetical protein
MHIPVIMGPNKTGAAIIAGVRIQNQYVGGQAWECPFIIFVSIYIFFNNEIFKSLYKSNSLPPMYPLKFQYGLHVSRLPIH